MKSTSMASRSLVGHEVEWGMEGDKPCVGFLEMEVNHLVDPSLECIRNFFHGINHGGDLKV